MARGQCFRMVMGADDWTASPVRCAQSVEWQGTVPGACGDRLPVLCCDEHVAEVEDAVVFDRLATVA